MTSAEINDDDNNHDVSTKVNNTKKEESFLPIYNNLVCNFCNTRKAQIIELPIYYNWVEI
jgi:hypothetical protein